MVAAAPSLNAPTPVLVVSCTDTRVPCVTPTLPVPIEVQFGVSDVLGPVIVVEIPVLTGAVNAHGLVKIVAVTVSPVANILSRIFNTKPTIVAFAGSVTVLVANNGPDEEVPRPIHPLLLID
jgi:hypothetical protein